MITAIAHLALIDDDEIELDVAALELSALDHEGIDLDPYIATLQGIEEALAEAGEGAQTGPEQAAALARVLSGDYGFAGDRAGYDAPINTDMIRVIDRRRGLPVSLSILYVAAARRMGWSADALNTPGHVLVSVGPAASKIVIDPFNKGTAVTAEQLSTLLSDMLGPDEALSGDHVAPMSNRAVLVRLLLNQATRAEQAFDPARALTVYERITLIAPTNDQAWWDKARLELAAGEVATARASLAAVLEVTRDPERRALVSSAIEAISAR